MQTQTLDRPDSLAALQSACASPASTVRGLTLACGMGDLEISWDPENDAQVREVIERKMGQGVRFFILKPLIGDYLWTRRKLTDIGELRTNSVKIKDEDIKALFTGGTVSLLRSSGTVDTTGIARTAQQAVANRTIGVPMLTGG